MSYAEKKRRIQHSLCFICAKPNYTARTPSKRNSYKDNKQPSTRKKLNTQRILGSDISGISYIVRSFINRNDQKYKKDRKLKKPTEKINMIIMTKKEKNLIQLNFCRLCAISLFKE